MIRAWSRGRQSIERFNHMLENAVNDGASR
jgi:hypothetical protein